MKVFRRLIITLCGLIASVSHGEDSADISCLSAYNSAKYEQAASRCKVEAAAGDAEAMFRMASLYAVGNGVPQQQEMAVAWLKEAYRLSHAEAGYNLAVAMLQGIGTEQDKLEARLLLTRLAADGYAKAQRELGQLFLDGTAGDQDDETALSLFQAASEQGDVVAKWLLARYLLDRDGATPEAMGWLRTAADAGNLNAQLQMGALHEADAPEQAEVWYRKAVRQGSGQGMYKLAFLLTHGPEAQRNLKLAASLAREAERRHIDFAENLHNQIRQRLQAQLEAAKRSVALAEANEANAETEVEAMDQPAAGGAGSGRQASPATISQVSESKPSESPSSEILPSSSPALTAAGCKATGRLKSACWWQQHSKGYYTLQLGAYRSGATLQKFISRSGLGGDLAITRHCAGDRDLNILTYGLFASEEKAQLARQALPARVQKVKPWLRTIAGLQKAAPCAGEVANR